MIIIAIISLVLGIVCGQWLLSEKIADLFSQISNYILYILMFSVGISVGSNKLILKKMKQYNLNIITIPIGIVIGSIVGGILSSFILQIPLNQSVAISSGMGWYSLTGVLITDLAGAEVGTLAFFSNLMRELISYMIIPIISKKLNFYTAIASSGATSMDTALPVIAKYTNSEIVIISVISGVICSSLVPLICPLLYKLFNIF